MSDTTPVTCLNVIQLLSAQCSYNITLEKDGQKATMKLFRADCDAEEGSPCRLPKTIAVRFRAFALAPPWQRFFSQ